MPTPSPFQVICRQDREGAALDVLGLNRFTLLIDRSETALTEAGWNYWKPQLDGPPHFHDAKEQLFFAVEGEGQVTVAGHTYAVKPGDLLHIPMGAMHRTVTGATGPQAYLLINAFRDADKEGKATFNAHVSESKYERRRQADEAAEGRPVDWQRVPQVGTLAAVDRTLPPADLAAELPLITRAHTRRSAAHLLRLGAGRRWEWSAEDPPVERVLYGLAGQLTLAITGRSYSLNPATVIYVPPQTPVSAQAGSAGAAALSYRIYLD